MIDIQTILDAICAHNPTANIDFVRKAHEYAASAYSGQRLRNGAPYISFPLAVADTLAHLRLDESTIAAALLYDTVVDAGNLLKDIREAFGEEVAAIADSVIRIRLRGFNNEQGQHGGCNGGPRLVMNEDARVLTIVVADRLHTMRILDFYRPEKQKRIAREVKEIYVPLATRLGLHDIEQELKELAFRYAGSDEEIYVLTSNGAKMFLPKGATPVDFAYQVHTEVGNRCVGAKIDGRLKPLSTELHDGDTVEVITAAQQFPRQEWLEFVKTDEARTRIQSFIDEHTGVIP